MTCTDSEGSQHLPDGMKYQPDATPPQFADARNDSIQKGSAVRIQVIGLRSDVGAMHAIGKMSAEWFGYVVSWLQTCMC